MNKENYLVFLGFFLLALAGGSSGWVINEIGFFDQKDPAFGSLIPSPRSPGLYDYFVTQFSEFHNGVFAVWNVHTKNIRQITPTLIEATKGLPWPNEVNDAGALWNFPALLLAGGFIVPGHETGGIWFINNTGTPDANVFEITQEKKDYFYHRAIPVDLLSDGNLGILTCRAKNSMLHGDDAELVYLTKIDDYNFKEHVIDSGVQSCDTFFRVIDLDGDGYLEIISGVFFGNVLKIYWADKGQYLNSTSVHNRIIDSNCGCPFDLLVTDLNADGKPDLLMTDSEEDKPGGNVFAYEIPEDFRNAEWPRHLIASGFDPGYILPGHMAPGVSNVLTGLTPKPLIIFPGDDLGNLYVSEAKDQDDPKNWEYATTTVYEISGTVDSAVVADVDGDGFDEIFVTAYSENAVWVFRAQ